MKWLPCNMRLAMGLYLLPEAGVAGQVYAKRLALCFYRFFFSIDFFNSGFVGNVKLI